MSDAAAIPTPGVQVQGNQDSGVYKVTIPVPKTATGPTKVDVDNTSSKTHEVHVDTGENEQTDTHPERRRNPMPTQVVVQQPQPTGGLQGPWATIANMSAVGFVLVLSFVMYNDFRSSVKEQHSTSRQDSKDQSTTLREEIRLNREANDRNVVTLTNVMSASTVATNALTAEVRAGRLASDARVDKLEGAIEKLTAIIEKKMVP